MFSERSISAVPIIDEEGVVVNLYETVDVIVSRFFYSYSHNILIHDARHLLDWVPIKPLTSQYQRPLIKGRRTFLELLSVLHQIRWELFYS